MKLPKRFQRFTTGLVAAASIALIGVSLNHLTFAASGSLSLSPSSGSVTVGNNLTVTLNENSSTDATVGVDAVINYSSNLQFVSATTTAPFTVAPPDSASGGSVEIVRGYAGSTPPTGNQAVSVLTFKAVSAGTGSLSFNNSRSSIAPASGSGNLLVTSSGGSYSLTTPVIPPPPPPPTPTPTPSLTPATPAPSGTAKGTSVNIAPRTGSGSKASTSSAGGTTASPVTVPDNGAVAVNTPVSVEPATIQSDGVKRVEYYLAGKLVDTETKPPYKYNIDTAKLKNGTYQLVSKTYYTNGTTKQATQHLIVKNAALHSSSNLTWLYLLIVGIILLLGLGVNFVGPSVGNGRFHNPFGGHSGGHTPAGWPNSSVPPSGGAPPTGSSASPASLENPSQPTLATRLNHLDAPHGPTPGTIFHPHERS